MKKTILTAVFAFAVLVANAQLKVHSGGKVSVSSTTAPSCSLYVAGNVGLGTTTANEALEIKADSASIRMADGRDVSGWGSSFKEMGSIKFFHHYNTNIGAKIYTIKEYSTRSYGGTDLRFAVSNVSNNSIADAMTINYLGRVGIGTTTPGTKLDVDGIINIRATGYLRIGAYNTSSDNFGYISSAGNINGTGLKFETATSGGTSGVTRMTILNDGKVGIGTTSPGYLLSVNGQPGANGYTLFTNYSDSTLKCNITNVDSCLKKIMKLRPVQFNYNNAYLNLYNDTNALTRIHKGFLAQEVKQIFPEMVGTTDSIKGKTYQDLNLSDLQVYLVKAMQEQQKMIDSLTAHQKIADSLLAICCSGGQKINNDNGQGKVETTLQIELANKDNVILYQNEPNPFDGSTVIRYFIPENTGSAYIGFYDMYGKEIKKLEITEKGFGKIEAGTENLASGIYSYSIIMNEKVVDTKKMIKNK